VLGERLKDAFGRLGDDLVNDILDIAGAMIGFELAVRARAFLHNPIRVADFFTAAEFIDDVANKPIEQFVQQFARGQFDFFAEVN
jgi:hypothetical protein